MTPKTIQDKYQNELRCGDMVCFAVPGSSWRQTPQLMRACVAALIETKTGDFVALEKPDGIRVLANRVVKCY